jgi:hypothetical protein
MEKVEDKMKRSGKRLKYSLGLSKKNPNMI